MLEFNAIKRVPLRKEYCVEEIVPRVRARTYFVQDTNSVLSVFIMWLTTVLVNKVSFFLFFLSLFPLSLSFSLSFNTFIKESEDRRLINKLFLNIYPL